MAIKARNAALSILLQTVVCFISFTFFATHQMKENIIHLYHEGETLLVFMIVVWYFICGLPVFFTNYYFTQQCFKVRTVAIGEITVNILLMAACNALYQIIIFKVIAGEKLDAQAIIIAIIGMVSCIIQQMIRYMMNTSKTA